MNRIKIASYSKNFCVTLNKSCIRSRFFANITIDYLIVSSFKNHTCDTSRTSLFGKLIHRVKWNVCKSLSNHIMISSDFPKFVINNLLIYEDRSPSSSCPDDDPKRLDIVGYYKYCFS